MTDYNTFLKRKGLTDRTIQAYQMDVNDFLNWCEDLTIEPEFITYDQLLSFIASLREKQLNNGTIQKKYIAIRHYYDLLIKQELLTSNPVSSIQLKGKKTRPLYPILTPEQIEGLYTNFKIEDQPDPLYGSREKVSLGLMVYQGASSGELGKLTIESINLEKGSITIKGTAHRATRNLALQPAQIMGLFDYIQRVRPQLIAKYNLPATNKLLIHTFAQDSDAARYIIDKLKTIEPSLINAKHLRTSVITRWIRTYNLREVQYLAGHHNIRSTELYLRNDSEGLINDIDKFHPSVNR